MNRLEYILQNPSWDPDKTTVVEKEIGHIAGSFLPTTPLKPSPALLRQIEKFDGYRLFKGEIYEPGVLTLPVSYTKDWKARFITKNSTINLDTIRANHAFLGVVVPQGKGQIILRYNDKPALRHWFLGGAGLAILIALFFFLKRQRYNNAPPSLQHYE